MRYFNRKGWLISLLVAWCYITGSIASEPRYLNIVFIGNSITYGAGLEEPRREAPPVRAAIYLKRDAGVQIVRYSNQGVSGCTTVDFLPDTDTYFRKVREAADQFKDEPWATLLFSIMLGTNDSAIKGTNGCPLDPEGYRANMRQIIDRLLALYPNARIVVHRPIWYSPNTYNGAMYLREGLDRLTAYYPEIVSLVEEYGKRFPGQVFLGDTAGYDYFKAHVEELFQAEEGNAGTFFLHPNKRGAVVLGELWGKAIARALYNQ